MYMGNKSCTVCHAYEISTMIRATVNIDVTTSIFRIFMLDSTIWILLVVRYTASKQPTNQPAGPPIRKAILNQSLV